MGVIGFFLVHLCLIGVWFGEDQRPNAINAHDVQNILNFTNYGI